MGIKKPRRGVRGFDVYFKNLGNRGKPAPPPIENLSWHFYCIMIVSIGWNEEFITVSCIFITSNSIKLKKDF
jgi:hypothetical protein